jgi:endonuclease IV
MQGRGFVSVVTSDNSHERIAICIDFAHLRAKIGCTCQLQWLQVLLGVTGQIRTYRFNM